MVAVVVVVVGGSYLALTPPSPITPTPHNSIRVVDELLPGGAFLMRPALFDMTHDNL